LDHPSKMKQTVEPPSKETLRLMLFELKRIHEDEIYWRTLRGCENPGKVASLAEAIHFLKGLIGPEEEA